MFGSHRTDRTMPSPQDTEGEGRALPPQGQPAYNPLPFSPSNPPKNIHAKPIAKSLLDREGLDKALRQVGEKSGR